MKTFEINCIIADKENPSVENEDVIEIILYTTIIAESLEAAIEKIKSLYNIKTIIDIQEII
jgi:hypothetical protein